MSVPILSVVVASHDRALRLRWLLNALDQQTLERSLWEVVVGHDSSDADTERVLVEHPLTRDGVLRAVRRPPGTGLPGANRNAALSLARAPTVVFTDDDCRPPTDWLDQVLTAVRGHPGAIVQGPVAADPDENAMLRSTHPRTQSFDQVPRPWAECCNIVYPKELIERAGGFREDVATGEDADLNQRVQALGALYVGEKRMLTYHAVEEGTALDAIRGVWRWADLAALVKRHPQLRREFQLGIFWKPAHLWLLVALVGLAQSRRRRAWIVAVLPWALQHRSGRDDLRGALRDIMELPGWGAVDLAEVLALAGGSIRHRSLLL